MAINTGQHTRPYGPGHIDNQSFDPVTQLRVVESVGFDGQAMQRMNADNLAVKIVESGDITYIARAKPGSSEASAVWQALKIDESSGLSITWADGDSEYDNIATDLSALSYS